MRDYALLLNKDIDTPEALDFENFKSVSNGRGMKELRKFCRVKHTGKRKFVCEAWLRLFEIAEPVIPEYVREFLASIYLEEAITTLNDRCIWFQLGGDKYEMNMQELILAMGLYTKEEVNSSEFKHFYKYCWRKLPNCNTPKNLTMTAE